MTTTPSCLLSSSGSNQHVGSQLWFMNIDGSSETPSFHWSWGSLSNSGRDSYASSPT